MRSITLTIDVPEELEARIRAAGRVDWGQVGPYPDIKHVSQFCDTLMLTREHFDELEGDLELSGLYLTGTEVVLCHTGVSPNSPLHARILTGLWNALLGEIEKPDVDAQ